MRGSSVAIPPSCLRRSGSGRWSRRATCTASARKKVNSGKMRSATLRACRRFRRQWWLQSWWPSEAAVTIEAAMGEDISQQHGVARLVGSRLCAPDERDCALKALYGAACELFLRVIEMRRGVDCFLRGKFDLCVPARKTTVVVRHVSCCVVESRREISGGPCGLFGVRDMCAREVCLVCFSENKNNCFVCETCVSCCQPRTRARCARHVCHVVFSAKQK